MCTNGDCAVVSEHSLISHTKEYSSFAEDGDSKEHYQRVDPNYINQQMRTTLSGGSLNKNKAFARLNKTFVRSQDGRRSFEKYFYMMKKKLKLM